MSEGGPLVNVTVNNYRTESDDPTLREVLMATRDEIQAGFTELQTSMSTLTEAITAGDERDAARIAELEGLIETLQANDAVDAETIATLQNVVDGMNADNEAVMQNVNSVNATVDTLISGQTPR